MDTERRAFWHQVLKVVHCLLATCNLALYLPTVLLHLNFCSGATFLTQFYFLAYVQTATMSKESNKILPKEYIIKVQSVKSSDIRGKRTTFGKAMVNLTEYCTLEPAVGRDVTVQLK